MIISFARFLIINYRFIMLGSVRFLNAALLSNRGFYQFGILQSKIHKPKNARRELLEYV